MVFSLGDLQIISGVRHGNSGPVTVVVASVVSFFFQGLTTDSTKTTKLDFVVARLNDFQNYLVWGNDFVANVNQDLTDGTFDWRFVGTNEINTDFLLLVLAWLWCPRGWGIL
ncbi:hypothetical protein WICPIJ_007382 [Wickerhamomyces pijperi]|uniref:Uncharacterized protein n=1 Tax=Wickerhamomyces pijperi TaxID=599730 RepID=A0A9P8Q095_WICPI|nr:hypothetical protein WICPIJ_007382 [Wickerhamomyces pijperi]